MRVLITSRKQWEDIPEKLKTPELTVITSLPEIAAQCLDTGIFCIGLEPEGSSRFFPHVSCVVDSPDSLDDETVETMRRRFLGLPVRVGETGRLLLREGLPGDFEVFSEACREADRTRKTIFLDDSFLRDQEGWNSYIACAYSLFGTGYYTAVTSDRETGQGQVIGFAGFSMPAGKADSCVRILVPAEGQPPEECWELGYYVIPAARRQGYAFEMCREVIRLGIRQGAPGILVRYAADHPASAALAEKLERSIR